MKNILTILSLSFFTLTFAQVGIGTDTPRTALEVQGELTVSEVNTASVINYIVVWDEIDQKFKKVSVNTLNISQNVCPKLIREVSNGYYLKFESNSSITLPNNPLVIEGRNFVSGGTWIQDNIYHFSYNNTSSQPININNQFTVDFSGVLCIY